MILNNESLKKRAEWEARDYRLPDYDRFVLHGATIETGGEAWFDFFRMSENILF